MLIIDKLNDTRACRACSAHWASPMTSQVSERPVILCIDDAEVALQVRKLLLPGEPDYSVITAASGEEGLELFKQNSVDLVIADHFLSDKTGVETARGDEAAEKSEACRF